MHVAHFLNELEMVGFPIGTYPMDFNTDGDIVVELQIGHDNVVSIVIDEIEDEFILTLNDDEPKKTSTISVVITQLEVYIDDFGY